MMAKNPTDRPQTPAQLRQEIEKIIEEIEDREPAAVSQARLNRLLRPSGRLKRAWRRAPCLPAGIVLATR